MTSRGGSGCGVASVLPRLNVPARVRSADRQTTAWLEAARSGAVERFEALYAPTLTAAHDNFGTALHHSAVAPDNAPLHSVQWLLSHGVPLESANNAGHTALHVAAHVGHDALVVQLLKAKASPHARCKSGRTPLVHAAFACNAPAVRALIDASNVLSNVLPTVLSSVSQVQALIDAGAVLAARGSGTLTAR